MFPCWDGFGDVTSTGVSTNKRRDLERLGRNCGNGWNTWKKTTGQVQMQQERGFVQSKVVETLFFCSLSAPRPTPTCMCTHIVKKRIINFPSLYYRKENIVYFTFFCLYLARQISTSFWHTQHCIKVLNPRLFIFC